MRDRGSRRNQLATTSLLLGLLGLAAAGANALGSNDPNPGAPGPARDGLRGETLADGFELLTHGVDPPVAPLEVASEAGIFEARSRPPVCARASEPQLRVVYARPAADGSERRAIRKIRAAVGRMNGMIVRAGKLYSGGRERLDLRATCTRRGKVDVATLGAPNDLDFASLVGLARARDLLSPSSKYLIFYADRNPDACGIGQLKPDDRDSISNLSNNLLPMYAVVWRQCWDGGAPLHEVSHMMGAVQNSAPHSSGAAHCNDGFDLMCYDDGGPDSRQRSVCSDWRYDCGRNDYFDPTPRGYLADHWNLAEPTNRYLSFR